jgi:hypothetical protein
VRGEFVVNVSVKVGESHDPSTSWSKSRDGLIITLPKAKMPQPTELVSTFQGDLSTAFEETARIVPLAERPVVSVPVDISAAETWVDAIADTPAVAPQHHPAQTRPQHGAPPSARKFDYIPDIRTLSKPDELLSKPPYYLVLYASRRQEVEVECSHSPTLVFLSEYLKKWVKANHQSPQKVRRPHLVSSSPCLNSVS